MAAMQKGLGRGLGALFQDEALESKEKENTQTLPVGMLLPNPKQPRRDFDRESLEGLAESIKSQGVLQPILVRPAPGTRPPRYEIVAGERRWRASQLAGLAEVPVVIRELSDEETLAVALIENLQREDLNPLEEALGMHELKEEFGLSQEELSKTLGKSRSSIANSLRLLNLNAGAQEALRNGTISAGHARAILALGSPLEQESLLNKILEDTLSVREAEGWAATRREGESGAAGTGGEKTAELAAGGQPGAESTVSGHTGKAKRLPQSAILLDLQERFAESLGLPVRFSGKESRGKISISYSSREELAALLHKLGVTAEF